MDRGTWQVRVHGVTKSQTPLSNGSCMHILLELTAQGSFCIFVSGIFYVSKLLFNFYFNILRGLKMMKGSYKIKLI